jgi:hypothetical protein
VGTYRPVTDAERERIRELHAQGVSAKKIADQIGRPQSTVSRTAAQMGISFDRSKMAAAHAARRADAEERRRNLAEQLLDDAEKLRGRMWGEFRQVQYVGKDGDRREDVLAEPPPKEQLDYARAMQITITQMAKLFEFDREKDEQGRTMADRFVKLMLGEAPEAGDAEGA